MQDMTKELQENQDMLARLKADEQELLRLDAENQKAMQDLQDSGSKDFVALSEKQGRQTALQTMLADARSRIYQNEQQRRTLEANQYRFTQVQEVAGIARDIRHTREQFHTGALVISEALKDELNDLFQLHARWVDLQTQWQKKAKVLGVVLDPYEVGGTNPEQNQKAWALYAELEAQAIDTEALRLTMPPYMNEVRGSKPDVLPLQQATASGKQQEFEPLLASFFTDALHGWYRGRKHPTPATVPDEPTPTEQPGRRLFQVVRDRLKSLTQS